ncbi:MAG: hypothetical protein HRT81_00445 [Henriciella sp.]|nr:hypothetical protein [Henriciella sp.]
MTDSTVPPLSPDETPIDAEFEPAPTSEPPRSGGATGPGWFIVGLSFLIACLAFFLAAATAGFVPGFKPGTGPLERVRSDVATLQTDIDQDLSETATLSTDIATLESRADSLSADRTRTNADLRNLRTEIETLQADISMLQRARVASLADPAETDGVDSDSPDLAALSARVAAMEDALVTQVGTYNTALETLKNRVSSLEDQAASEQLNAASASNARTEAALALSAIEAAARRGRPFLPAQQKLAAAMPNNDAVARLSAIAPKAVPTLADLRSTFPTLRDAALDASAQAEGGSSGWMRQVFGDGIQVRRAGDVTTSDHLDQAKAALDAGNLSDSVEHIRAAGTDIQPVFTDWVSNAVDRLTLEQTLEALRLTMIAEKRP